METQEVSFPFDDGSSVYSVRANGILQPRYSVEHNK